MTDTTPDLGLDHPTLVRQRAFVDGTWVEATSGAIYPIIDPATGEVLAEVPAMDADDARRAIEAADRAFPGWAAKTASERGALLRRWFDLMVENADDLGRIMTLEQGKPLPEARGEVLYGASFVEWFAEEAKRAYGDVIPSFTPNKRLLVLRQPVGVAAAITPWNFPQRHDHPQGRARARRRLYFRGETGRGHTTVGPGSRRPGVSRRHPARGVQRRHRAGSGAGW
jgi:hypothetical protein